MLEPRPQAGKNWARFIKTLLLMTKKFSRFGIFDDYVLNLKKAKQSISKNSHSIVPPICSKAFIVGNLQQFKG
jgi:hypothetical protein